MPLKARTLTANCGNDTIGKSASTELKSLFDGKDAVDFIVINCQEVNKKKQIDEFKEALADKKHLKIASSKLMVTMTKPELNILLGRTGLASFIIYNGNTIANVSVVNTKMVRGKNRNKGGLIHDFSLAYQDEPYRFTAVSGHFDSHSEKQRVDNLTQIIKSTSFTAADWNDLVKLIPDGVFAGYDANTRDKMIADDPDDIRFISIWEQENQDRQTTALKAAPLGNYVFSTLMTYQKSGQKALNKRPGESPWGALDFSTMQNNTKTFVKLSNNHYTHAPIDYDIELYGKRDHHVIGTDVQTFAKVGDFVRVQNHIANRIHPFSAKLAAKVSTLTESAESKAFLRALHNDFLSPNGHLVTYLERLKALNSNNEDEITQLKEQLQTMCLQALRAFPKPQQKQEKQDDSSKNIIVRSNALIDQLEALKNQLPQELPQNILQPFYDFIADTTVDLERIQADDFIINRENFSNYAAQLEEMKNTLQKKQNWMPLQVVNLWRNQLLDSELPALNKHIQVLNPSSQKDNLLKKINRIQQNIEQIEYDDHELADDVALLSQYQMQIDSVRSTASAQLIQELDEADVLMKQDNLHPLLGKDLIESLNKWIQKSQFALVKQDNLPELLNLKKEVVRLQAEVIEQIQAQLEGKLNVHRHVFSKRYATYDKDLKEFIRDTQEALENISPEEQFKGKLQTLFKINNRLEKKSQTVMKAEAHDALVQNIANRLISGSHFYTTGMKAKAKNIRQKWSQLTLDEKADILDGSSGKSSKQKAFLEALARHRHIHKQALYRQKDGQLNEKKSARSFKLFKKEVTKLTEKDSVTESRSDFPPKR